MKNTHSVIISNRCKYQKPNIMGSRNLVKAVFLSLVHKSVVRLIMVLLIHSYTSITYKHNNDSQFSNTIPSKQQKLYPAPSVNN